MTRKSLKQASLSDIKKIQRDLQQKTMRAYAKAIEAYGRGVPIEKNIWSQKASKMHKRLDELATEIESRRK